MSITSLPLQDRVDLAIRHNPQLSGRRLTIEDQHGRIVLQGTVGSYYQKQLVQETVWGVDGVDAVVNRLQVSWPLRRRAK